jgi:hypothetical protein
VALQGSALTFENQTESSEPLPDSIAEKEEWPPGALALVNDPVRTGYTQRVWSDAPNHWTIYLMKVENPEDVQRLVNLLADIQDTRGVIKLSTANIGESSEWNTTGARVSVGSNRLLREWYERLPEVEPGVKKYGINRYTEPPGVLPVYLTLFVTHKTVKLHKLDVPLRVEVEPAHDVEIAHKNGRSTSTIEKIDSYVAAHKTKREQAGFEEAGEQE